jgi:hypothetical protein
LQNFRNAHSPSRTKSPGSEPELGGQRCQRRGDVALRVLGEDEGPVAHLLEDHAGAVVAGGARLQGHSVLDIPSTLPTVLRMDGFRFYFFSNERNEPPHVHVRKGDGKRKFWLEPVALAWARGLRPQELSRARELVTENRTVLLEAWHGHSGTTA